MHVPALYSGDTGKPFYLTILPAGLVTRISYAARRRMDNEDGAVQRILNPRRIQALEEFALGGGDYPNSVVLNWVNRDNPLNYVNNQIEIIDEEKSAQIIDGQHRIAGLEAAIKKRPELGRLPLPVTIYSNLNTQECAELFVAINTEQRPAPRSLVFDLFPLLGNANTDPAAIRAYDVAVLLNEESESPYNSLIRFPGMQQSRSGVQLSTFISAIKPMVKENGDFEQYAVKSYEGQSRVIMNFLKSLQQQYGEKWHLKKNAFLYSLGFQAAIEFLKVNLLPACYAQKSFAIETFHSLYRLTVDSLIYQEDFKGLQGRTAQRQIKERLEAAMVTPSASEDEFQF